MENKKCGRCGGWGKGLVNEKTKLCNHCTRQLKELFFLSPNAFDVPTEKQSNNQCVIADKELQEKWIREHYGFLGKESTWMTAVGEPRTATVAMPLPQKMTFVQCELMADHYGYKAEKTPRKICSCNSNSWKTWALGCNCPTEDWIVYRKEQT